MFDFIYINRLSIFSIIYSIGLLWFIIHNVKKERIKEAYAIIWLIMGLVFLAVSIWPRLMSFFAGAVGIYYAPAFLILVLTVMSLLILIQFSIVISRQAERIKTLTQEMALLKIKLEENNTKNIDE